MTMNSDLLEEYLNALADRYDATELVELLELSTWDIIEMYREKIVEMPNLLYADRN